MLAMSIRLFNLLLSLALVFGAVHLALAQSVGLPSPRLLTTIPMGGKAGTQFEVVVTGEHLDDAEELIFSDSRITASRKLDASGVLIPDRYMVTIAPDCPVGLYESRIMTRLGVSSSRIFTVGKFPEFVQSKSNKTLESAIELPVGSVFNGTISERSVDYFKFIGKKGQRLVVDCASTGIDSKLNATVIIADAAGRDLLVERLGGVLDYSVPKEGTYVIKIHELTFKGGPAFYYRLGLWEQAVGTPIIRQPSTKTVNSYSWPPIGLSEHAASKEIEPNNDGKRAQKITLPCDISGSFYPASDVDFFEFEAKKGEQWWIEVGSERLGLQTDPAILIQHVARDPKGGADKITDVLELTDIISPVKVSSNGYAYDGPPYNPGSSDILGKLVIKEDGTHRLQITDLFGGTRNDPNNIYRLIIRRATPDFALVSWAMHMELRNGDRNALSKPISLRGGATMALEVVAFRRDGFDGEIEITMEGLPKGVKAHGLKIPVGQSRGMMLITADQDAPRGYTNAKFFGQSKIDGKAVVRPCRLASVAWPIPDSWGEIPSPRLLADVPVAVSGIDFAPITITAKATNYEVTAGEKLVIPLVHKRRSEFSGDKIQMKVIGAGFENAPRFDLPIKADSSQVTLDLAVLKTPPGEYTISFLGGAVVKYSHKPDAVALVEAKTKKMMLEVKDLEAEAKKIATEAQVAPAAKKDQMVKAVATVNAKMKAATDALNVTKGQLEKAAQNAKPKDIADIVVSEPIMIRVKPGVKK